MATWMIQRFDPSVGPNGGNTWMDKTSAYFTAHPDKAHQYKDLKTAAYWQKKLWPDCLCVPTREAVPHPAIKLFPDSFELSK